MQTQLLAVVAEVPGDGERRGGEDPCAPPAVQLLAEDFGDRERRGVEPERVSRYFYPPDQVSAALVAPSLEQAPRLPRALGAAREPVASFGEDFERTA